MMRGLRAMSVVGAVLAASVVIGAGAWACATQPVISVQPATGTSGSVVKLSGASFRADAPVEVFWGSVGGPRLATATGPTFTVSITVPQAAPGVNYIVAESIGGNATAAFTVTAPAPAPAPAAPAPEPVANPAPVVAPAVEPAPTVAPASPATSAAAAPVPARARTAPTAAPAPVPTAGSPAVAPAPEPIPEPVQAPVVPAPAVEPAAPVVTPPSPVAVADAPAAPQAANDSGPNAAVILMAVGVIVVLGALGAVVAGVRPRRRARPAPSDRP